MAVQHWNGATLFAFTAELNDDARIIYTQMSTVACSERADAPMTEEYICGQALDRAFELMTVAKQDAEEIWKREAIEGPQREEYLRRAKDRALILLSMGDPQGAITSILSDLSQRADTKPGDSLGAMGIIFGVRGAGTSFQRNSRVCQSSQGN